MTEAKTDIAAKRDTSNHTCHALGCRTHCKPEWLMCLKHWRMVPRIIQSAVYANYRDGQCGDLNPSRGWVNAAKRAIRSVAQRESMTEELILAEMRHWDEFADAIETLKDEKEG